MKASTKRLQRIMAAVGLVVVLLITATTASAGNPGPNVLPPHSRPYGAGYGEWGARWWQWALAQPASANPLVDEIGQFCNVDQHGPVWFLAGIAGAQGKVTRTCTIPFGKAIFFPVANNIYVLFPTDPNDTPLLARQTAAAAMKNLSELWAEVDGVPIRNLKDYQVISPDTKKPTTFPVKLPDDNILGVTPANCPGLVCPAAAEGIQLMLAPLTPGQHVIKLHAGYAGGSPMDVTYNVTVGRR